MTRYWIGVASREHVHNGITCGIAQMCHGKQGPLKRMQPGDWIIYYSPKELFGGNVPCRKFTAIGKVKTGEPYLYKMSEDFIPWRRDVQFYPAQEIAIQSLLAKLSFTKNSKNWGFIFRRGFFEITPDDFQIIAAAMGVPIDGKD